MLKSGAILNRLYEMIEPAAQNLCIADMRIGLSYVGIKLDNEAAGIAAVLPESSIRCCTVLKEAGTFIGSPAVETLKCLIEGKNPLRRAIGVATANALVSLTTRDNEDREATTYLHLKPGEKLSW